MADTKTSALTALTGVDVETDADVLMIVDDSVTTSKKIVVDELRVALRPVIGTAQATTSGTEFDFTVPTSVRKIMVSFRGVSLSGTDEILVQLGDSGGVETSGYVSSSGYVVDAGASIVVSSTSGFICIATGAGNIHSGHMTLVLHDSSTNAWTASHSTKGQTDRVSSGGGDKALSAAITTVRVTRSGTDTFDAGSVNIQYE